MLESIAVMFSYGFMARAFIVGILTSLCLALLGVSLVLKRYSMIGDGLSHVGFGAVAVAMALGAAPLAVAVPVVMIAAFLLLMISDDGSFRGDAAVAVISSSALAIGVMSASLSSGINSDVHSYLFGSVLAMSKSDVMLSVAVSVAVLLLYVICYNRIFAITFDETFGRATGLKVDKYNTLLAMLTAVTVVVGMRMMGALLISSLVIFPALSAMRVFSSFRSVVICSALVSAVGFCIGIAASYWLNTPAGASVVIANLVIFLTFSTVGAVLKTNE
ncbi:MAG: metal ABC transporter permease [Oscillospiraceae bacterium]|nr:metal ABC transporter permease [Oscillospiraceae bacterium]